MYRNFDEIRHNEGTFFQINEKIKIFDHFEVFTFVSKEQGLENFGPNAASFFLENINFSPSKKRAEHCVMIARLGDYLDSAYSIGKKRLSIPFNN